MISRMAAVVAACGTGALLATPAAPVEAATPGNWPQHGGGAASDNYQPDTGGLDVRRQVCLLLAGDHTIRAFG